MEAEEELAAVKEEVMNSKEEMESKIKTAMLSRLKDFKNQADNLTEKGVRRALEKDLGMERLSLDAHKKFIKQCLEKYFSDADKEKASETEEEIAEPVQSVKGEALEDEGDLTNSSYDLNKNLEESEMSHESPGDDREINEDIIKKAIKKRAAYFRGNLEITLIKVRRLLEEDLKLEKGSLDAHKKFISNELDAVLQSSEIVQAINGTKKEIKKASNKKVPKKASIESDSSKSDEESSDEENDEMIKKPKKRPAEKTKNDTKGSKRQKISMEKKKTPTEKKPAMEDSDKSDEDNGEKSSEDSEEEREVKKKTEKPTQVYGKQVERLRSTIKSCGLGIPPSIYKRVKQAPESKREAHLIKELEMILEKEGLSTNPSEKEIKEAKKRKQLAKDLEGIDTSNIVSSSRRRTASSYIPPPKPKVIESGSDDEGGEDEDDEENEEDSEGDSNAEDSNEESGDEAGEESD